MKKILIPIFLIAVIFSACVMQTTQVTYPVDSATETSIPVTETAVITETITVTESTLTEVSKAAIVFYLSSQKDSRISEEDKIRSLIHAYFTLRYESQKNLAEQDFSALLEDVSLDWFQDEKAKREIELYLACVADLNYESYYFSLAYIDFQIESDEAIVTLEESHFVVFQVASPDPSGLFGLAHVLTLHKKNDVWVIFEDLYEDEKSHMLEFRTKEEIINQIHSNLGTSQEDIDPMCRKFID